MYRNVLVTAGITDASVMISAPYPVSGTAALSGIYKAYEDVTGGQLDESAKRPLLMSFLLQALSPETIGTQMRHCL